MSNRAIIVTDNKFSQALGEFQIEVDDWYPDTIEVPCRYRIRITKFNLNGSKSDDISIRMSTQQMLTFSSNLSEIANDIYNYVVNNKAIAQEREFELDESAV